MRIEIDNADFSIRLYHDVAYLKVKGMQDQEAVDFFSNTIDKMLESYPHEKFSSVCDLTDLILSSPKLARQINQSIRKINNSLNYEYNAVVVKPKFLQIMQAYVFSFYMNNTNVKTHIFKETAGALAWLHEKGYQTEQLKNFLNVKK